MKSELSNGAAWNRQETAFGPATPERSALSVLRPRPGIRRGDGRRSRRFLGKVLSLLAWLAGAHIALAAELYTIDAAHSEMSFAVRNVLSTVTGRFTDFSGTVDFNRQQPERSSVEATIQVRSIDTGIKERDRHLLAADFFDAQKFPTIHFKSASIEKAGDRTANVRGSLTMHGSTLPVLLHVELLPDEKSNSGVLRWRVTADLQRSKFGLKWNPLIEASQAVGDDINIRMKILTPAGAPSVR